MMLTCRSLSRAFLLASFSLNASAETPAETKTIVANAERIRSADDAVVKVELGTATRVDGKDEVSGYDLEIHRGTGKRGYVKFVGPPQEVGRKMLVVGSNYWAKFPDSKKVHRISRKEMIGNSVFQLVDLFQLDVDRDYDLKHTGYEQAEGADCHKVEMTGKSEDAPYARIQYFIAKKDNFPVLAIFFTASGKRIKTLKTLGRSILGGIERPASFEMKDDVTEGRFSTWKTLSLVPKKIPDRVFDPEFLVSQ
jgi:hypothetical protein